MYLKRILNNILSFWFKYIFGRFYRAGNICLLLWWRDFSVGKCYFYTLASKMAPPGEI